VRKDEELQRVVLRSHQMRAVERVQGRARNPEKKPPKRAAWLRLWVWTM
jgi:hypothetical protein